MRRLFVAIRPPDTICAALLAATGGISGARWLGDDQLHLTLRFIGEVDRHMARDIDAALAALHFPGFSISVSGIGTFERRGQTETVWAGVSPHEPVKALHKKIDQALSRVGLAPERRAFLPHITLARLNRSSGPPGDFVAGRGGLTTRPFEVDRFGLYESRLTPDGPVYLLLEEYRLG